MFSAPLLIVFTHCEVQKESGVNVCSVGVIFFNQIACSSLNEGFTSLAENPRHTQCFHSLSDYNLTLLSSVTEKDVASITECKVTLLVHCIPHKSRVNRERRSKTGEMLVLVPSLGLFFISRVKSGLCFIRRHGCPRKSESHDAASSPQSTVSTLGEGGRLYSGDPRGKSTEFWCCLLFAATSNRRITGWMAFFLKLVTRHVGICQRRLISSPAPLFVFP